MFDVFHSDGPSRYALGRTLSFVCLRALDLVLGKPPPPRPSTYHRNLDDRTGCGVIGVASSAMWVLVLSFFCLSEG